MSSVLLSEFADYKAAVGSHMRQLQQVICRHFESVEQDYANATHQAPSQFTFTPWNKTDDYVANPGGGIMSVMKGQVFEKVGVNFSEIHGRFSEAFIKEIPGAQESEGYFYATGVSLVAHMANPFVPAIHMNTRMLITNKPWFGGGIDLTPCIPNPEVEANFHQGLERICNQSNPSFYPNFKQQCDDYFYIKHRKEPRGVGGIFYDYLYVNNPNDFQSLFNFSINVGNYMWEFFPKVASAYMHTPYTQKEKDIQLMKRSRYVEFNLLYDRGTRFGLMTNGNVEAILMSMPPMAMWI